MAKTSWISWYFPFSGCAIKVSKLGNGCFQVLKVGVSLLPPDLLIALEKKQKPFALKKGWK